MSKSKIISSSDEPYVFDPVSGDYGPKGEMQQRPFHKPPQLGPHSRGVETGANGGYHRPGTDPYRPKEVGNKK